MDNQFVQMSIIDTFEKTDKNLMIRIIPLPREIVFANGKGLYSVCVGMLITGIALLLQGWTNQYGLHWQAIVFSVLCLSQMGDIPAICSKSQPFFSVGARSNKPLIAAVIASFALQFLVTYLPFIQTVFKMEALTVNKFILIGAAS